MRIITKHTGGATFEQRARALEQYEPKGAKLPIFYWNDGYIEPVTCDRKRDGMPVSQYAAAQATAEKLAGTKVEKAVLRTGSPSGLPTEMAEYVIWLSTN